MDNEDVVKIRKLNDLLRCQGIGGRTLITSGVQCLEEDETQGLLKVVTEFTDFSSYNDPYFEHDCATVTYLDQTYVWKIDYYDKSLNFGSPDPSNSNITERVLTIMRADEY